MNDKWHKMLEQGYAECAAYHDTSSPGYKMSRLQYLSEFIFNFTTYEDEIDELFAGKAVEVCAAIIAGNTFEYIADKENRVWFLLMCNMPFFNDKLNWGSSIRGAWWDAPHDRKIEYSSCGLYLDGEQIAETMEFTRDEWQEFIGAVIRFAASITNQYFTDSCA